MHMNMTLILMGGCFLAPGVVEAGCCSTALRRTLLACCSFGTFAGFLWASVGLLGIIGELAELHMVNLARTGSNLIFPGRGGANHIRLV